MRLYWVRDVPDPVSGVLVSCGLFGNTRDRLVKMQRQERHTGCSKGITAKHHWRLPGSGRPVERFSPYRESMAF